jgi:hypothetical protein
LHAVERDLFVTLIWQKGLPEPALLDKQFIVYFHAFLFPKNLQIP